eukprot:5531093-Alexandrium_andersonii.AAC.1
MLNGDVCGLRVRWVGVCRSATFSSRGASARGLVSLAQGLGGVGGANSMLQRGKPITPPFRGAATIA